MNDEQRRLNRLRERQLTDRDPLVKQKQFQHTTTQRERRVRSKRYTLSEAWQTLPHIYRSPLIGLLIGLGITIVLSYVWNSPWAFWVGVIVIVLLVALGVVIGQALDIRERLRDSIKH
jgi:hypothetical protein